MIIETIKFRWTYVLKYDRCYKARLVAKWYTQIQGIDYEETFSPVARYKSIWYLLAHAALQDWEIEAMDVKLAYLYGVLEEEIYMEQLEGFVAQGEQDKVCRLILYVDDPLLLGEDLSKINDVKRQLGKLYQMKDLGPASFYLGIQITRDWNTRAIWIDQQAYIENALNRFELLNANNTNTSLPAGIHLEKSEEPVALDTKTYNQQIIGTLIYAAIGTRPNIAFMATRLSWFNNNPTKEHIKYNGSSDAGLIGYSDPDWGENRDDCHSTSGHIFLTANGVISWASQQQKTVTLSVGEAEYMELASTGWQAAWLRSFSGEIGFPIEGPIPLCLDNQAAIFLMVNPAVKRQTKHIYIQHHYIWAQYKNKVIEPFHIAGIENPADLFTRSLPVIKVEQFRSKIRLS